MFKDWSDSTRLLLLRLLLLLELYNFRKGISLFLFVSHSVKLKRKTHSYTFVHFRGSTNFRLYRTNSTPNFQTKNIKNISKYIIFAPHRKLYSEVFPGGCAIFSRARDEQDQDRFFYFSTVTCNFQLKREIMIYLGSTARRDTKEDGGITIAVRQILTAYITVENIVANTAME